MTTSTDMTNGIDVGRLMTTIDAVAQDPAAGLFTFRATSTWKGGTLNAGRVGRFVHAGTEDESRTEPFDLVGDEPPVLLGGNRGPNAVELVLQALAFCYAVGLAANAAARGIELTRMEYEVEGDFDARAFLGLEGPRAGLTGIRARGTVSSPNATPDQLQELCRYVQQTSPVRDTLTHAVPVETTLTVV